VFANTAAAENAINTAARDRTSTIHVNVVEGTTTRYASGPGGVSTGGRIGPRAAGGIDVPGVVPMASGGIASMAHLATVVQPGMKRLIGDNMRVPESFIPWDVRSASANAILDRTNIAFGRTPDGVQQAIRSGAAVSQVPMMLSRTAVTTINVNVPNYVGSRSELVQHIKNHVWKASGGDVQKALGR